MKYNIVSQRCVGLDKPVKEQTIIPPVQSGSGDYSDEVILQPGEWLEIISYGSPTDWSKAVIRGTQVTLNSQMDRMKVPDKAQKLWLKRVMDAAGAAAIEIGWSHEQGCQWIANVMDQPD